MAYFIVFLAALTVYLPFNAALPVTDPVESNYALTALEMLNRGDWLSPSIYGQYWFDKPVLTYWLIMISYKLFGIHEFAARLPAGVFSALSISFLYWFANRIYRRQETALYCALVLATALEFWLVARLIITDAMLFFFSSAAVALWYLAILEKKDRWNIPAYAAAGLAVLTKGPVGLVLPVLILFVYLAVRNNWRDWRRVVSWAGIAAFMLVAFPWYYLMYRQHGMEFITTFFGLHNYLRATVSEHPEDNVFYYYLIVFPLSLMPWAGVFLRGIAGFRHLDGNKHFTLPAVWTLVIIGFYSLMATKYLTYVLPALFPAALITGQALTGLERRAGAGWFWLTVPTLLLLAGCCIGTRFLPSGAAWYGLYIVTAAGAGWIIWLQYKRPRLLPLAVSLIMIVTSLVLAHGLAPFAGERSAKALAGALPAAGAELAAYGDYPTSAVFYSGYVAKWLTGPGDSRQRGVWSGKYTMPAETFSHFMERTKGYRETYILVDAAYLPRFISLPESKEFQSVASHSRLVLFRRIISP